MHPPLALIRQVRPFTRWLGLPALLLVLAAARPGVLHADAVMYRVNCGGPELAPIDAGPAWSADVRVTNPSPYVNAAATGDQTFTFSLPLQSPHPSVPAYVPAAVFDDERWDPDPAPDMLWQFPVANGLYRVNLCMADAWQGTQTPGARVFDTRIEGVLVQDDFDIVAAFGSYTPGMVTFDAWVADGALSIEFGHVVDAPTVRGIEVRALNAAGVLGVTPVNLAFGSRLVGTLSPPQSVTLTNLGGVGDPVVHLGSITVSPGFLHDLSPQDLAPGESRTFHVRFAPQAAGAALGTLAVSHDGVGSPVSVALSGTGATSFPVGFGKSFVLGGNRANPTSLQFGPDGRLYVAEKDGRILAMTVSRDAANTYTAVATESILVVRDIPNHDDDGQLAPGITDRLVTGLLVTGTAVDPVIYVTSSDPRMNVGGDIGLDTNSGVLSRIDRVAGVWTRTDLVRGLPRSEDDHSTNGMALDPLTNTLYVGQGGQCNMGAPSYNFSFLAEYALSAAVLSVDLDAIGNTTYDLPTLDDEDRAGVADLNDPFGGNDGKNQAKLVPGGPVQVHSSGYRNPFDVVIHSNGHLYTVDNGPNLGWGGPPIGEGPGGTCTNADNDANSASLPDNLHMIPGPGYYAGHPNPTRASTSNTFNVTNPQSPVPAGDPQQCEYREPGTDGSLAQWNASTNGLVEYRASNFGGALQGAILAASFDNSVQRIDLNAAGDSAIAVAALFGNIDITPLDLTAQPDGAVFPGTVWVADYVTGRVWVFEPSDYEGGGNACSGADSPALDEDGDGFSNADEIDNGTSPCSAADRPADFDGDLLSNRNDPDDDNDGLLDPEDAFARDATNGSNTTIPVVYTWDSGNPGFGFFGLGFTGLMANGTTDYLTQFDPAHLTPGGAAGKLTVDVVDAGDALGAANSQNNAFQFGVATDSTSTPFTARTQLSIPWFGGAPADSMSFGLFVGDGRQDDYVSVTLAVRGGVPGIAVTTEHAGAPAESFTPVPGILAADGVELLLDVQPAAGTIQPRYRVGAGARVAAGPLLTLPAGRVRDAVRTAAPLAVGILGTSRGAVPFGATWDFIEVVTAASVDAPPAPRTRAVTRLLPAAPHPMRRATSVRFELAAASRARVTLHGVDGRLVRTFADGWLAAGPHAMAWDGRDARGQRVAPGVYFVRFEADGRRESGRIVVIE